MTLWSERNPFTTICGWNSPETISRAETLLVISPQGRDHHSNLEVFNPTAAAVCIERVSDFGQSELLLIQRGAEPSKGSWSYPGGKRILLPNSTFSETVYETAYREAFEETRLQLIIHQLRIMFGYEYPEHNVVVLDSFANESNLKGFKPIAGRNILKAKWIPASSLDRLQLTSLVKDSLPLLISPDQLPTNLRY